MTCHFLQENVLFSAVIFGSVFSDYVVFYGDKHWVSCHWIFFMHKLLC